jgi:hypothetical protein
MTGLRTMQARELSIVRLGFYIDHGVSIENGTHG